MDLEELRGDWDELGRTDPLWAVLTAPGKRGGGWRIEEFFKTGEDKIAAVMNHVEALDVRPRRGRALDFGSGVGRLTQALADHFDAVVGVDIAASMVEKARALNRKRDRCVYVLNETPDLAAFGDGSFDFVYSNITLQHMPPTYMRRYLAEFLRVLDPSGLAVFEITSRPSAGLMVRRVIDVIRRTVMRRKGGIRMYWMPPEKVTSHVERCGGRVIDVGRSHVEGGWTRFQYCVAKGPG